MSFLRHGQIYQSDGFLVRAQGEACYGFAPERLIVLMSLRPAIPWRGCGRDGHRCPPPAQIRTGGITAYGSSLGYERRSVRRDMDEECGDEESTGRR